MNHRCLVLNMDYTFLGICNWQDAISNAYCGRAVIEESYEDEVHSVSSTWRKPAVIRLKKFVRVAFEKVAYVSYTKQNVHRRDNYTCQYCGVKDKRVKLTIDHVLPECRGGRTTWQNTVTACEPCNADKDNRTPEEAGMKLLRKPDRPHGFREIVRVKLGEIHDLWTKYL